MHDRQTMFLVDSHCHLDLLNPAGGQVVIDTAIEDARAKGVQHILNVCIKLADFEQVLRTAKRYPFVSASVGLHPNEREEEVDLQDLLNLGKDKKVVAIGETGLDYYRSSGDIDWQRLRFITHIEAARTLAKPLIIHMREATADTIRIMQAEKVDDIGGVMHCFSEDWSVAKKALDLNFYISFSGIVTFKNAIVMQEVAKKMPLDRILIETDAPYLAPQPMRGKPNEPAFVRYTAEYIAKLREMSLEDFGYQTTENFFNLFKGAEKAYV